MLGERKLFQVPDLSLPVDGREIAVGPGTKARNSIRFFNSEPLLVPLITQRTILIHGLRPQVNNIIEETVQSVENQCIIKGSEKSKVLFICLNNQGRKIPVSVETSTFDSFRDIFSRNIEQRKKMKEQNEELPPLLIIISDIFRFMEDCKGDARRNLEDIVNSEELRKVLNLYIVAGSIDNGRSTGLEDEFQTVFEIAPNGINRVNY